MSANSACTSPSDITHDEEGVHIVPILNIAHVKLDDLVGYELPKKKLVDNTEAFVNGKKANNCLLLVMQELANLPASKVS